MRYLILLLLPLAVSAETLYTFEIGFSTSDLGCYSPSVGFKAKQHDEDVEYSAGWINPKCGQSTPYIAVSRPFVDERNINELVYSPGVAWVFNKGDTFSTNYQMINHAHITHDDFYMGATKIGWSPVNLVFGNRQKPTPKKESVPATINPGAAGGNSLVPVSNTDDGPMSPPSGSVPVDTIHEQEIEGGVIDDVWDTSSGPSWHDPNIPHDFSLPWYDPKPPYDD